MNVDLIKDPYGLGTVFLASGSINLSVDPSFCYYPLQASTAILNVSNVSGSTTLSASFTAGIPIYACITAVSQSSGYALIYSSRNSMW